MKTLAACAKYLGITKTLAFCIAFLGVMFMYGVLIIGNFEDIVDLEKRFVVIQTQGNQLTERAKLELTIERLRFEKEGVITCLEDATFDNAMLRDQILEAAKMIRALMTEIEELQRST